MVFKRHAMGDINDRSPEEQLEARFHQLLCCALISCQKKGDRKSQGYIMGAFRQALSEFKITVENGD